MIKSTSIKLFSPYDTNFLHFILKVQQQMYSDTWRRGLLPGCPKIDYFPRLFVSRIGQNIDFQLKFHKFDA